MVAQGSYEDFVVSIVQTRFEIFALQVWVRDVGFLDAASVATRE